MFRFHRARRKARRNKIRSAILFQEKRPPKGSTEGFKRVNAGAEGEARFGDYVREGPMAW